MHIGTTGIVTNEYNELLLIMRDDTRSWCAPGGSLDAGELPTDGTAREVKEETGIYTLPIRLVAADFWPTSTGTLHFTFRCLKRGGEPTPSAESPQVDFYKYNQLPSPMLSIHRDRLTETRDHVGAAVWSNRAVPWRLYPLRLALMLFVYPFKRLRRRWRNEAAYEPPVSWDVSVMVAVADGRGGLQVNEAGGLPRGRCTAQNSPWDVAQQLVGSSRFSRIAGIYVTPNRAEMSLVFADDAAYQIDIPADLSDHDTAVLKDIRLDPDNTRVAYCPTLP